jgi:DNA-binding NarL/FixJ family response regulator
MKPYKILLVDDHALFRKGIAALLASRDNFIVVGEAENGREAIVKTQALQPDVVLMDVHMPECDGPTAVHEILKEQPEIQIIMLTIDETDETLFEAIKNGARGYLMKSMDPEQVFKMIETVAQGGIGFGQAMLSKVLQEFQNLPTGDASPGNQLTPRELEILEQVSIGATNQQIAEALNITENTVKKHIKRILTKLHKQNRTQAAVYAVREGLLPNTDPHN